MPGTGGGPRPHGPRPFDDPTALPLLRDGEREPVEQARTGTPPDGWRPRVGYEMLTANAEVMVPRTVAVDDGVRAAGHRQLPSRSAALGRWLATAMLVLARREDPTAAEPHRSRWAPAEMRALLEGAGFTVVTDDGTEALARSLDITMRHPRAVVSGRVAVADLRPASPR